MIVLTESQIARIQAGATLEDLGVVVTPPTAEEQAAEKAAADKAAADKIAADKAAADAAAAAGEKGATEGTGLAAADAAIVAHLQTQVDAKAAQVATLTGELTTLKASHSAMQATHDGLMTIVRQATTNMLIPMGGSGDALAALPADQLVAQYNETRTKFLAKFPVGGKGMVAKESGTSAAADVPVAFAAHAARISKSN